MPLNEELEKVTIVGNGYYDHRRRMLQNWKMFHLKAGRFGRKTVSRNLPTSTLCAMNVRGQSIVVTLARAIQTRGNATATQLGWVIAAKLLHPAIPYGSYI